MDAVLGVLVFGGLALLGVVALVQSASRPNGRALPGTRAGRPTYSPPKPVESRAPTSLPSAPSTDRSEVEALLLNTFNAALAEVAERSAVAQPSAEEIDDLVIERSLEAVMANRGVTRREAAGIILEVFESGRGRQGSPLAMLRAVVANG